MIIHKNFFSQAIKYVNLSIIAFCCFEITFAGVTGKISGRVTDSDTGEPLIGTNIVIRGISMGAASDIEGYYFILNVPPATYDVTASMVGYTDITFEDIRVEIDRTTKLDFQLKTEVIEGELIIVRAERKLIKEDIAASQISVTSEQIEELPYNSIADVISLQAGIAGNLEIRGGDSRETVFIVDGTVLRDARNNDPVTTVPLSAVQEISVQTGGFSAEYHNVRSGVVNVATKEGNPNFYSGTISFKQSPASPKHFGISVYDNNSFWLRPYLDPDVCWTGTTGEPYEDLNSNNDWDEGEPYNDVNDDEQWTGWDKYTRRQYPEFDGWNAKSDELLADDDQSNDLSPLGAKRVYEWEHRKKGNIVDPDYNIDAGFGGPVPLISDLLGNLRFYSSYRKNQEMYLIPMSRDALMEESVMLKLTSDVTPAIKLSVLGFYSETYATALDRVGGTNYMDSVDDVADAIDRRGHTIRWRIFGENYWSRTNRYYNTISAKLTHVLNPGTFYNIILKNEGKVFRTGPIRTRDTEKKYEIFPNYFVDEAPFGFYEDASWGIEGMGMGGSVSTSRDSTQVSTFTAKADFQSQVNYRNEVKAGLELVYHTLDMRFGMINKLLPEGNTWTGLSNRAEFKDNPEFKKNPYTVTAYIRDKMEYKGFIATFGLNMDYTNPNSDWFDVSDYDREFYSSSYDPQNDSSATEKAETQLTFSPRLGVSHPITVNSKLYFNYGHYRQIPTAETLYREQRNLLGGIDRIGDPNLPLEKTISYELGYDQALMNNTFLLQLRAYYKDITDQQDWTWYTSFDSKVIYRRLTGNSYEDIRGFEVELSKLAGRWIDGIVNYEYRVNTYGYFGSEKYYEDPGEQREFYRDNPKQTKPLPRPRIKAYLNLHTPPEFGPKLMHQRILGGWYMNFIMRWTAGRWITWNPRNISGIEYNVQRQDYFNVHLKVSKMLSFGRVHVRLFLDIYNLFNIKNFSWQGFYDSHDYDYYMYSLHLPEETADKLGYPNIPGDDRPGDVRPNGVEFVPLEWVADTTALFLNVKPNSRAVYYIPATEISSESYSGVDPEKYYEYIAGEWSLVDQQRIDQILEDKAYIDMPNQSYFNFLDPRDIFFGINFTFDL